jgi:signal transduction histidine kinase
MSRLMNTPFRRDCAFAVLVAAGSMVLLLVPDEVDPSIGVLSLLVAQSLFLALRRVRPLLCVALVIALQIALAAAMPPGQGIRGPALAIAVYTGGTLLTARRAYALAGSAALAEISAFVVFNSAPAGPSLVVVATKAGVQLILTALVYGAAALLGLHTATRRRLAALVELRAAEAAEAQRARVESALAAERSHMARELHDVAAHHLTSLIVQATLVERLLDRDIEAARRSAAEVREEGRNTLRNLRLIVGALRDPVTSDGGAPVPGLAMIDELAAGVPVVVSGEPRGLPPAADLTVYRVAQEALSNARDHAPGAAVTIAIRHRDRDSTLEVRNGPATRAAPAGAEARGHRGFGLTGMRERATLIGATLTAGPTGDGGWLVELTVPSTEGDSEA